MYIKRNIFKGFVKSRKCQSKLVIQGVDVYVLSKFNIQSCLNKIFQVTADEINVIFLGLQNFFKK